MRSIHRQRGFLDGLIGGVLGFMGAEKQNDANAQMSAQQMAFQERMSSTAYQRAVADMQAAGLNPMLAYSQGGASTPQGAKAEMVNSLGAGVSAYQQSAAVQADVALKEAQQKEAIEKAAHAKQQARDTSLSADMKEGPAAIGRMGGKAAEHLPGAVDSAREATSKVIERVLDDVVPGLRSSAADLHERAVNSTVEAAERARDVVRSIPERAKAALRSSAEAVRRSFENPTVRPGDVIPPAERGKPMGKSRGKLGGARSWDYDPDVR